MTIETLDGIAKALGNNSSRIVLDKASIASQAAGTYVSLWRATGQPGQGAEQGGKQDFFHGQFPRVMKQSANEFAGIRP